MRLENRFSADRAANQCLQHCHDGRAHRERGDFPEHRNFFTFIFSRLFPGEEAYRSYVLIFAAAITGIVLAKPLQGGHMPGNLVALAGGVVYAAMVTYMRYEGKTETSHDIAWSMPAGAITV